MSISRQSDEHFRNAAKRPDEISLIEIVSLLVEDASTIVGTVLVTTFLCVLAALLWPPRYTASTSILPPQQNGSVGAALMSQASALGSVASLAGGGILRNPNELQVAILKSRTVEDAMVDRFQLMSFYGEKYKSVARKRFENSVAIDSGAKDGIIRISVTARDPKRAADLANAYVEEFKELSAKLALTEASQRRVFFEQQLGAARDNLAGAEEDLKRVEQTTGLIQVDSQTRAVIELVAQLRGEIAAKEVQIQGIRSYAAKDNPTLQVAEEELAGLRSQADKLGATGSSAMAEVLVPKGNLQQSGLTYTRVLRTVKYYETIYNLLARQYEASKLDEARQGTATQIIDVAVVPDRRSSPSVLLIGGIASLVGFFLGVVLAVVRRSWERSSASEDTGSRLRTMSVGGQEG